MASSVAINMDENSIRGEHTESSMIDSRLHECVRLDDIEAFKSLVQTHSAEKLVTPCGNTLLHVAVSYGSDNITSYLAQEFPSLITTQNSQEDTVLHLAARDGKDSQAIKSLVELNPCLMRKPNTKGNTPLHDAVINGNRELAKFLVSIDPEVAYSSNKNGRSPLYLAVENGNMERILDDLLKSEASITIPKGKSTFLAAIEQHILQIIDKILGRLCQPPHHMQIKHEYYAPTIRKSPAHAALKQRNKGKSEYIEKAKPELLRLTDEELRNTLHYASSIGKSPVHAAIKQRNKGILEKIKEARPELLRLSEKELGNSLHYASSIGFLEGVQFLLQNFRDGAYERDSEGNYPIHLACKSHSVDVVKEYLDIFPYPKEFLNKKGQNILHVAAENGKDNVISYILKQDSKLVKPLLNEMDDDGNTPLHLAAGHFRPMASFLLVRHNQVARLIVNNRNWTPYDLAEQQSKRAEEEFLKANEMDGCDHSKDVEDGMENSTARNSTDGTSSERKDKAKRATEKTSPKNEGLITFFGMVTTLSILYFYAGPKKSLREYFTVTPRHISQAKEESKTWIGNLLVIAVLVAGVTFAGAVQMPELRDYNNSREQPHESNSAIAASHYRSYENHLYGYLFLDLGAFSTSMVASLILLWANFNDARFILLGVQFAAIMVFSSIIMMFGAFFLSLRIALLGSPEVWLTIALIVVAVVFFLVQAFLFWPWFLPSPVEQIVEGILFNYFYYLCFFTLFYSWRWLTEKLPELPGLKKKLKHPREQRESRNM
ncbi:hypothetical protein OIU77_004859 [Salix suchowensis]|uniref:PGG domain-containing protein n=1 Tax=Salix suchowensis TaxID=1278906 RepID=A0ABQ9AVT4_9ROSI|nr:hypothetical protein OIU77_004859 [Salix suchowensis]